MTTITLDGGDVITVPGPGALPANTPVAGAIADVHADVFAEPPEVADDVVDETLAALERHLTWVALSDILELGVLVESDATDPEAAFVDTLQQSLDHLASWQ